MPVFIFLFFSAVLFILVWLLSKSSRSIMSLPPGPPADPLIGHVRLVPRTFGWIKFTDWVKEYGNVIYIHTFGKPIVILSSYEAAKDLLERRSANYLDRPQFIVQQELMDLTRSVAFARHGERLKKLRRLIVQPFNAQNSKSFRPVQRRETYILLHNILTEQSLYENHIERAVSGSIMSTAYGHQIESNEDEFVYLAKAAAEKVVEGGTPGTMLVDFVPILRFIPTWMPGAGFKRHALKTRELFYLGIGRPFAMVQNRRAKGKNMQSVTDILLEEHEQNGFVDPTDAIDIRDAVGTIYGASVETTISTLRTFLLAIITHPEVAKKAQEEIDRVIGIERLPDFSDRPNLPYLNCILKEVYRWNPALPLGIPHGSLNDDVYKGMRIPHGSTMIANIWAMMMDPSLYEEPQEFNPDRFFPRCADPEAAGRSGYNELDPEAKVFGFGGRICPGRFYADSGLWLTMTCLLATFEILPPIDKDGKEKLPPIQFTSGLTSQPAPFQCRFNLRKESYASLINNSMTKQREED